MKIPFDLQASFPVLLACGALAGSGFAFWNTATTRARWLGERELQSRLVEIERGIASTRQLLQESAPVGATPAAATLQAPPAVATPTRVALAAEPAALDEERLGLLLQRIEDLEVLLAATDHRSGGEARNETVAEVMTSELARQSMIEYQHLWSDEAVDWPRRIDALRMLRRFPEAMDALGPRMVDAALGVLRSDAPAARQAQVIDAIEGVRDPRLPGELLRIARTGQDERLRAESVGALEDFLDDPAVRGWLEEARTSDASEKVRRLAERALY